MKKLLALVLALTLALGTFSFAAAATPEDVVDTDYETAVARLGALDILAGYPDGTFRPDQPVTRAEFAKIIVHAMGVGEAAQYAAGATKFWDVPADHWATGYINVAVDIGIINGYPDGSFQPESQVTFAEAIKMIVAALGYTPKAEAMGGYPGGYIAIAAEKEITDGVNVVGVLAADRGAIAMMVDNALTVPLMERYVFGDKAEYEENPNKNLLTSKLGYIERKGDVIDIARTNSKFKENEFKFHEKDKKGELTNVKSTYKLQIDVNTESIFLKEVKIFEKDDKVAWVSVTTPDADLVFDTVKDPEDGKDIKLKVKDKEYNWVDEEEPIIYVNYVIAEEEDVKEDMYGLFVFDGNKIKAANLFDFAEGALVTKVSDDELEYIAFDNTEDVLEIDEYDDVYYYYKDFSKAELEDIDENSAIFFWEDEDEEELSVVVVNDAVEGEVSKMRDKKITVDGKNYDRAAEAIASLNAGKDFDKWVDTDDIKDLMEEDVLLVLDYNGEVVAAIGKADVTSDTLYGVVTWAETGRKSTLSIFGADGKVADYDLEKRTQIGALAHEKYMEKYGDQLKYAIVSYELNSDGEIADGKLKGIEVVKNSATSIFNNAKALPSDDYEKEANKAYMFTGGHRVYANADTLIIQAIDVDELDPDIISYDEFKKMEFDTTEGVAVVFGEEDKTAKMIVFISDEFDALQKDVYFGVVTDDAWRVTTKNWRTTADVFGEGKTDYILKDAADRGADFKKGSLVAFRLDSNDKAFAMSYRKLEGGIVDTAKAELEKAKIVTGEVYKVDGSYITIDDSGLETYKVKDGAVIYATKDGGEKLDGVLRLTRVKAGEEVFMLLDEDEEVTAMIVEVVKPI